MFAAKTPNILVCDDQPVIHETLGVYLKLDGFDYTSAYDGAQALELYEKLHPDLIVLDLMMPKVTGTEVCREIRKKSNVPVIMLTAKGEEIDRILGLELGADDYIVKPFSPREVVARIKAVLRRLTETPAISAEDKKNVLQFGNLEINLLHYEVRVGGQNVG